MCKHPFWRQRWSQPRARTYPWRGNGRKAGWCCHPQQGWERRNILTPHWFGRQDSRRIKLLKSRSRAGFLMEHSLLWVLFVCKEMQNVHNMCTYMYVRTNRVGSDHNSAGNPWFEWNRGEGYPNPVQLYESMTRVWVFKLCRLLFSFSFSLLFSFVFSLLHISPLNVLLSVLYFLYVYLLLDCLRSLATPQYTAAQWVNTTPLFSLSLWVGHWPYFNRLCKRWRSQSGMGRWAEAGGGWRCGGPWRCPPTGRCARNSFHQGPPGKPQG